MDLKCKSTRKADKEKCICITCLSIHNNKIPPGKRVPSCRSAGRVKMRPSSSLLKLKGAWLQVTWSWLLLCCFYSSWLESGFLKLNCIKNGNNGPHYPASKGNRRPDWGLWAFGTHGGSCVRKESGLAVNSIPWALGVVRHMCPYIRGRPEADLCMARSARPLPRSICLCCSLTAREFSLAGEKWRAN